MLPESPIYCAKCCKPLERIHGTAYVRCCSPDYWIEAIPGWPSFLHVNGKRYSYMIGPPDPTDDQHTKEITR